MVQVQKEKETQKRKIEHIRILKQYAVDRWTTLLPAQELGVVDDVNGGGWIDWTTMAITRPYALMLKLIGVAVFV